MSDAERQMITSRCKDAQRIMQRIQYVDPIARVNRGNAYSNLTKLMTALGARTAYNSYNVPSLVGANNSIQNLRQQLSKQYTVYEIAMRDLISYDCSAHPKEFYEQLTEVRMQRADVASTISQIEQQLDVFSAGMLDLQSQMKARP